MNSNEIRSPKISDESDSSDGSFEDVPDLVSDSKDNTDSTDTSQKIKTEMPTIKVEFNPDAVETPSELDLFKDVFDSPEVGPKEEQKVMSKNTVIKIEINPDEKTSSGSDIFEDVFDPQVVKQSNQENLLKSSKSPSPNPSSEDYATDHMAEKMKQSNHLYLKIASKYLVNMIKELLIENI